MHLLMIGLGLTLAWWLRSQWSPLPGQWDDRWQHSLFAFLVPPCLLLMTAIAVLCMGPHGHMFWSQEGWFSFSLAISILIGALLLCLNLAREGYQTIRHIAAYPELTIQNHHAHCLDIPDLYSAQIGFWHPRLVISQGLLDHLDSDHLSAVLAHEQAHVQYRDTFWFFWLGWIRRLTAWLPQTEALWQELLLLREMRADRWAAQRVDPLLLAEALVQVVSAPLMQTQVSAGLNATGRDRLTERIDYLLTDAEASPPASAYPWNWLLVCLLPLASIPFHS
ncbi:MAG: M56 family metallopeptidase [Leptolyngbyaceae cyanobacterium]